MSVWPSSRTIASFVVVAVAASAISEACRKTVRLPLITGYILAGILCGPYVIEMLTEPQCKQLAHIVNSDAMGFIGLSAGAKFLLSELQGSLRPVLYMIAGQLVCIYACVFGGLLLAAPWLELLADREPPQVVAIALIIACLAVARSRLSTW